LVKIVRTSAGYNSVSETGHTLIQGGRFHGNRDNVAADLYLNKPWFARVAHVEFHRHLIGVSHTPAHDYWKAACILVEDCWMGSIESCEFFNLGNTSTNVNYPAIGILSLQDPAQAGNGVTKQISIRNCIYDNKVLPLGGYATDHHPFVQYYGMKIGHRFDLVSITDNTLIGGHRPIARFDILDNGALATGEGLELFIPQDTFGAGLPATNRTITATVGTYWAKAGAPAGAHGSAVALAAALNTDPNFNDVLVAGFSENTYAAVNSPSAGPTVTIQAREFHTRGNAVTIRHVSSVPGSTSCSVGWGNFSATVAEGATDALDGGFGQLGQGTVAIILQGDSQGATPIALGTVAPRNVRVSGNLAIGFADPLVFIDTTGNNDPVGPDVINDWAADNTIATIL
jgi:hypothetical protein